MPHRDPILFLAKDGDFINRNASRHDRFSAKAPRTASGQRYRIQLTLHQTTQVRSTALADKIERYLQSAKTLLDRYDLDLRVLDSTTLPLRYAPLANDDPQASLDLEATRGDMNRIADQVLPQISDHFAGAVPGDGSWLPVVFTPLKKDRGATLIERQLCCVHSEQASDADDYLTVIHEAAHASGIELHTNEASPGQFSAWPDGRNLDLLLGDGGDGRRRNAMTEKTLISLFEAEFCQPPHGDGVPARIV